MGTQVRSLFKIEFEKLPKSKIENCGCKQFARRITTTVSEFCCMAVSCVGFQKGSLLRALSHETLALC